MIVILSVENLKFSKEDYNNNIHEYENDSKEATKFPVKSCLGFIKYFSYVDYMLFENIDASSE